MIKKGFSKAPVSESNKSSQHIDKKAEDFINMISTGIRTKSIEEVKKDERVTKKDPIVRLPLRLPNNMYEDLKEVSNITGLTMNSICIELLRGQIKLKLKELKE